MTFEEVKDKLKFVVENLSGDDFYDESLAFKNILLKFLILGHFLYYVAQKNYFETQSDKNCKGQNIKRKNV